jgi:hypothetical protein
MRPQPHDHYLLSLSRHIVATALVARGRAALPAPSSALSHEIQNA